MLIAVFNVTEIEMLQLPLIKSIDSVSSVPPW